MIVGVVLVGAHGDDGSYCKATTHRYTCINSIPLTQPPPSAQFCVLGSLNILLVVLVFVLSEPVGTHSRTYVSFHVRLEYQQIKDHSIYYDYYYTHPPPTYPSFLPPWLPITHRHTYIHDLPSTRLFG